MSRTIVYDNHRLYDYLRKNHGKDLDALDPALQRIIKVAAQASRGTRPGIRGRILAILADNQEITTKTVQKQISRVMDGAPVGTRQAQEVFKQCRLAADNIKAYLDECERVRPCSQLESDRILEKYLGNMDIEIHGDDFA